MEKQELTDKLIAAGVPEDEIEFAEGWHYWIELMGIVAT